MGCCGGSGKRNIRSQPIRPQKEKAKKKTVSIQRVRRTAQAAPIKTDRKAVSISRQYVVPQSICSECGYPMMLVHISGRERKQCSNVNCRTIK